MDVYFGERWDAPAFDDAVQVSTPVGELCGYCDEKIEADDSGTFTTFVNELAAESAPVHIECVIRGWLGSPAHCRGECSCSGGEEPADDRSWRDQGRAVVKMVKQREGMFAHGTKSG